MAAEYIHNIDAIPLAENLVKQNKSLRESIDYRKQLNLALNCFQAENRLSEQATDLEELFDSNQPLTLKEINLALESYLVTLLSTPLISNLDRSQLTPHYARRKQVISDHFKSPGSIYLEELLFTSRRTWGTSYGTLGYQLHLSQEKEHYLHPSQIVEKVTLPLLKDSPIISEGFLFYISTLLQSESETADVDIYNLLLRLIEEDPSLKEAVELLTFLEDWLPKVIQWYLQPYRATGSFRTPSNRPEERNAFLVLEAICEVCFQNGLDDGSFENITYHFLHSSLPPIFFKTIEEIIVERKKTGRPETLQSEAEQFLNEFVLAVPLTLETGIVKSTAYRIMSDFPAPSGMNGFLTLIALNLLNRAYILSYPTNHSFSNLQIYPFRTFLPAFQHLLGRIFRLMYLAGYSLKKTNLTHLQILGTNLIRLTSLPDETPLAVTDLLQ